jgi:aminoglycoside/choline kinase family phosphotransferase
MTPLIPTNIIESAIGELNLGNKLVKIEQIPGDLSPRRYFRCILDGIDSMIGSDSIMAMVFDSVIPPESETKIIHTSDVAFLELAHFFGKHSIAVPKIFLDKRGDGVILLEDLGAQTLINVLKNDSKEALKYYNAACSIILDIQAIPHDSTCFAFHRALEKEVYKRETESFIKYFVSTNTAPNVTSEVSEVIDLLCTEIASFQKVLVHRDFHSWNLLVDSKDAVRVIDFQDALMGPRCYDLVAFLHERDVDLILSTEQILELEDFYFSHFTDPNLRSFEYPRVQLQRDIKTTGLFKRCVVERGLPSYGQWIPGNIERMKNTISKISKQDERYKILEKFIQDLG